MKSRGCGCCAAIPVLIFGLVFSGVGLFLLLATQRARAEFTPTTGVVIDLRTSSSSDGTTYTPVIEYEVDGVLYRFVSSISRSPAPDVGDPIGVRYDPDDPSDAIEDTALQWIIPGIALAVGLPVVGFGLFLFFKGVRGPGARVPGTIRPIDPTQGPTGSSDPPQPSEIRGPPLLDQDPAPPPSPVSPAGRPTTAQFRRVEPRGPDAAGQFEYRVVARDVDGVDHFSEWVREDPTTRLLQSGVDDLPLRWVGDRSVVEGF